MLRILNIDLTDKNGHLLHIIPVIEALNKVTTKYAIEFCPSRIDMVAVVTLGEEILPARLEELAEDLNIDGIPLWTEGTLGTVAGSPRAFDPYSFYMPDGETLMRKREVYALNGKI